MPILSVLHYKNIHRNVMAATFSMGHDNDDCCAKKASLCPDGMQKKTTTLLSCEGAEKVISSFEVVTGKQFVVVEQHYGFKVMCHCYYC